jgi:hypothetical protein
MSLYMTVIDGTNGTLSVYVNGTPIAQNAIARDVASFGSSPVGYIARSTYNDACWSGDMDDFAVYGSALSGDAVKALYSSEAIDRAIASVTIPTEATADFALPTSSSGVAITWRPSGPAVTVSGGSATVARPAVGSPDAAVTLTATYMSGTDTRSVDYPVTVLADVADSDKAQRDFDAITIAQAADVRTNVSVPARGARLQHRVERRRFIERDRARGQHGPQPHDCHRPPAARLRRDRCRRPRYGHQRCRDENARLHLAPPAAPGRGRDTEAYVWAFFTGESAGAERISLAASKGDDALACNTLNGGQPMFTSAQGTRGLRDPFIVRSPRATGSSCSRPTSRSPDSPEASTPPRSRARSTSRSGSRTTSSPGPRNAT